LTDSDVKRKVSPMVMTLWCCATGQAAAAFEHYASGSDNKARQAAAVTRDLCICSCVRGNLGTGSAGAGVKPPSHFNGGRMYGNALRRICRTEAFIAKLACIVDLRPL
jgi:hypothetical protein